MSMWVENGIFNFLIPTPDIFFRKLILLDIIQFFDDFTVCSQNDNVGPFSVQKVTISETVQKCFLCF